MATVDIPPKVPRRLVVAAKQPADGLAMLGQQLAFYVRVLAWVPRTLMHYPREILRLLSDVFFGSGALAVIGGTLGVMIGMTVFTGLIVGLQGYSALNQLGTSALTGFIAAYFDTREVTGGFTEIHGDPPHILGTFATWRRAHERYRPGVDPPVLRRRDVGGNNTSTRQRGTS